MAAYAAVASLMNNVEQIQNHPSHTFYFDVDQIKFLRQNVGFLLNFLQSYSHGAGRKKAEALESQIASAAYEIEDVIETHIVDQIVAGSTLQGGKSSLFLVDLQKVIEKMYPVIRMVTRFEAQILRDHLRGYSAPAASSTPRTPAKKTMTTRIEAQRLRDKLRASSAPAASSRPRAPTKNPMVGFDEELIKLLDMLTRQQSNRHIISIVGMGGMGKTTLAKNVYENSLIVHHFDIRIWVTISQESNTKKNLSELLLCLGKSDAEINVKTEDELGELLYKGLSGRRYLVILDDIWSVEAWNNVKVFFPDNNNRSRIVVTTRQSYTASHFGTSCLEMKFLDEEKSWNLFCQKIFSKQDCPPELVETGKKIVEKCKGLPLLIVLIGGHLRKSSRLTEYWENVGNDLNSILGSGVEEQCFDILSLSYNYLPVHLKPCFLYVGIFPEDYEISVSRLVRLWIAEGFLKPSKSRSLEEVAEDCLKDLVDRNLILVCKWSWNSKIKTCSIHDLLRELCLKIATKEMFIYVVKLHHTQQTINRERRIVVHGNIPDKKFYPTMESAPLARSLVCRGKGGQLSGNRLLRVAMGVEGVAVDPGGRFLELDLQHVNLRYLDCNFYDLLYAFTFAGSRPISLCLPSTISLLWNLQTLYIKGYPGDIIAPAEIWKMSQLRHVEVSEIYFPDPPLTDQQNDVLVLQNLQTLLQVVDFKLSEDVCKRIPNIKKLHLLYVDCMNESESILYYSPHNLGFLQKLESLRCSFPEEQNWCYFLLCFTFPSSLQKLHLENCSLRWDDLTIIGSLPHLEVLKLHRNAVRGSEWNPVEGEFVRLKFLKISSCSDLIYWNAESCHFPVLEKLVLEDFHALCEIPSNIGEIPTLQFIRLVNCSVLVAISAMRIVVEQDSLGNEDLQLEVEFWGEEELTSFRKNIQDEDLSSSNLRIQH